MTVKFKERTKLKFKLDDQEERMGLNEKIFEYLASVTLQQLIDDHNRGSSEMSAVLLSKMPKSPKVSN